MFERMFKLYLLSMRCQPAGRINGRLWGCEEGNLSASLTLTNLREESTTYNKTRIFNSDKSKLSIFFICLYLFARYIPILCTL